MATIKARDIVKIKPMKWSDEDIEKISEVRGLDEDDVRIMLMYNVLSAPQIAVLCGTSESVVYNATIMKRSKRTNKDSSVLTQCMLFPTPSGGKPFILVDQKCVDFIMKRAI